MKLYLRIYICQKENHKYNLCKFYNEKHMKNERLKKLESVAQELVSRFIFEELEDSEKEFWIITITWVKISSDLSYLDIYVSSMKNPDILPKTLAKHNHEIQSKLGKSLLIRKLPRIRFRYDNKWETWQNIMDLIRKECQNIK